MTTDDLDGKVIVVTGASRGIGKGLATYLARAGAAVVCAARTVDRAAGEFPGTIHETVDAIRASGGTATAIRCDIGSADDISALVAGTVAEYGRLDVLVNNAMTPTHAPLAESTIEMWDDSMRVNVRSLFLFMQAVTPVMQRGGGGSIVNISSGAAAHEVSALMPPGYTIYSVAKAALERFSSAAAPELRPLGINLNALRPGAVKTEHTTEEFGADFDWSGWAEPEDVGPPVAYLAAQIDTDFTGRVLDVSGYGKTWGPGL
ncbi:MAG TPA: SDR family oxidoreductase [Acidimicrobiia bacterium]|nr:SDR family oxidoreductase [Acidimicrobiia bacterium]